MTSRLIHDKIWIARDILGWITGQVEFRLYQFHPELIYISSNTMRRLSRGQPYEASQQTILFN